MAVAACSDLLLLILPTGCAPGVYRVTEKGNYTELDAAHIIRQILQGVQYLHSHGEMTSVLTARLSPSPRIIQVQQGAAGDGCGIFGAMSALLLCAPTASHQKSEMCSDVRCTTPLTPQDTPAYLTMASDKGTRAGSP